MTKTAAMQIRSTVKLLMASSSAVAFLEFLQAAAGARIIATHIFELVANWLLMVAMRAMDVALMMIMVMIVVAIRAVYVRLLGHTKLLRDEISGDYLAISHHVHAATE